MESIVFYLFLCYSFSRWSKFYKVALEETKNDEYMHVCIKINREIPCSLLAFLLSYMNYYYFFKKQLGILRKV